MADFRLCSAEPSQTTRQFSARPSWWHRRPERRYRLLGHIDLEPHPIPHRRRLQPASWRRQKHGSNRSLANEFRHLEAPLGEGLCVTNARASAKVHRLERFIRWGVALRAPVRRSTWTKIRRDESRKSCLPYPRWIPVEVCPKFRRTACRKRRFRYVERTDVSTGYYGV